MTHATQLALMVVWLGIDPALVSLDEREEVWRRMGGMDELDLDPVGNAWSACACASADDIISSEFILSRFPSCPECCVLLDMAREVAP